jgi:hypothetical protein
MSHDPQTAAARTRYNVLKLLSDDEVARVSTAETAATLSPGDEYLDLDHLEDGVRVATLTRYMSTANLLPKSTVGDATWRAILTELPPRPVASAR